MLQTGFTVPPMWVRVDLPKMVQPKQDHTDVSFHYSSMFRILPLVAIDRASGSVSEICLSGAA